MGVARISTWSIVFATLMACGVSLGMRSTAESEALSQVFESAEANSVSLSRLGLTSNQSTTLRACENSFQNLDESNKGEIFSSVWEQLKTPERTVFLRMLDRAAGLKDKPSLFSKLSKYESDTNAVASNSCVVTLLESFQKPAQRVALALRLANALPGSVQREIGQTFVSFAEENSV